MLAAISAGSLALAACGGATDDTAGTDSGDNDAPSACDSFTSAPAPEAGTVITPPEGISKSDGKLTIGSVLPQTGNLAFLGPPEFAAVELAVADINAAGGALGQPVAYIEGDSGDAQQDVANPTVDRLLAAGADVLIGAASSGVTKTFLDKATSAGAVVYSPANTSPDFTTIADKGLYFRTAPSDVLQGRVLGETLVADGKQNVAIIALQDPYGEGLAQNVGLAVCNGGSNVPVETIFYDPAAPNFDAQVGELVAADPDAIVLIGFEESAKIIQAMVAQNVGPQAVPLYLVDGNLGNALGEDLPDGLLEGTKGSLPGAEATDEFRQRLLGVDPALKDFSYSGESYDAVITSALAAIVADSDAGSAIAKALPDVTRDGEKCETFEACKKLLEGGTTDIDYDGVSGPIEFSDVGDPTEATIGIYSYGPDNMLSDEVDYVEGSLKN
jgi:branched-chain amino acid transport system substrate-binding protein